MSGELPGKGRRLRDFELTSASGHRIQLSDYRHRSSLVLIFTDDQKATAEMLSAIAQSYGQFKCEEPEIVAAGSSLAPTARWIRPSPSDKAMFTRGITRIKSQLNLPFPGEEHSRVWLAG